MPGEAKKYWSRSFLAHAAAALAALWVLDWLIARAVPIAIREIESSYWIFFYHFPAALNCYAFFTILLATSILYLRTGDRAWDRRGRVAGEVGLVACTITLATGSTWARMAWGQWWIWDDPRLLSASVMWLVYAGYVILQHQADEGERRRRWAAIYGILAYPILPIVHYAIQAFGAASHPQKFADLASDSAIWQTRWYGVAAFFLFYSLIYRWKLARDRVRDDVMSTLARVRQMEEGVPT